jgi:hypothetical protein
MRPWLPQAARYGLLYPAAIALIALFLGFLPAIPERAPLFFVSMVGAFVAFLSMWGEEAPTVAALPQDPMEPLTTPWKMFLGGLGLLMFAWIGMLLPY